MYNNVAMLKMDFDDAVEKVFLALSPRHEISAPPLLLLLSGLPGTGKSFLARKIAEQLPCVIVESDFVRKTLSDGKPTYASDESAFIHRVSYTVIERLLLGGTNVIHDATNLAEWHRELVYHLASRTRSRLVIIRTTAPEGVVRDRLVQRFIRRDPRDLSDADWNVHEQLAPELETVRRPHLVVDTSGDVGEAIRKILRAAR